ncbi:MAG: uroporphyrinogen decarboxylase family protein [Calditrichia bacterium]
MDEDGFNEFALVYVKRIIAAIRQQGVPIIYFAKGAMSWLDKVGESGADVVGAGLDDQPEHRTKKRSAIALRCRAISIRPRCMLRRRNIRQFVKKMLAENGSANGHIANLGHGILPDIPVEHAREFINAVKEESVIYHQS